MTSHDQKGGQLVKVVTPIHLRFNISTTVQNAALGQIPRSAERNLFVQKLFAVLYVQYTGGTDLYGTYTTVHLAV